MLNQKRAIGLLLLFVLCAVYLLARDKEPQKIKPQKIKDRTFKPLQAIKEFSLEMEDGLLRPFRVKVDRSEFLYIYDFGDKCIKKFSSDGKFIQKFGKGIGQGPGEFINPTDFAIKDNGEIWVCDSAFSYVTIFDVDGNFIKSYRTNNPPHRIGLFSTGEYLVIPSFSSDSLSFLKYDQNGEQLSTFTLPPPWAEKEVESAFLKMDGWLSIDNNDNIYYAFAKVGLLASFSRDGNLRFLGETIDRIPPPEVIRLKGGAKIDPKSPWSALSLSTLGSEIYILSHAGSKNRKGMVLDVYSSHDGSYIHSFEIPQRCSSACITERSIVAIADQEVVTKWKRIS